MIQSLGVSPSSTPEDRFPTMDKVELLFSGLPLGFIPQYISLMNHCPEVLQGFTGDTFSGGHARHILPGHGRTRPR